MSFSFPVSILGKAVSDLVVQPADDAGFLPAKPKPCL